MPDGARMLLFSCRFVFLYKHARLITFYFFIALSSQLTAVLPPYTSLSFHRSLPSVPGTSQAKCNMLKYIIYGSMLLTRKLRLIVVALYKYPAN
jgi:hypothetical protein